MCACPFLDNYISSQPNWYVFELSCCKQEPAKNHTFTNNGFEDLQIMDVFQRIISGRKTVVSAAPQQMLDESMQCKNRQVL